MGHIGTFLILQKNQLPNIIKGKSQQGMHAPVMLKTPLNELCIHQFPDQRRRQQTDPRGYNLFFHIPADGFRRIDINAGFPDQRLNDALPVPSHDVFTGCSDKEGNIRRVQRDGHIFVLMIPSRSLSVFSAAWEIASS